ncbi:MATE family efflux transporter [Candidatus Kapabacteria bacterium]|nr:MATE family efflux transporter [Candidatus Kapabacteria bacterium]
MSKPFSFHIKNNLKLALPVALGNMMHMITALADTLMVSKVGVTELAAVGFVNAVFMLPFLIGTGVSAGITAAVGKANGSGNTNKNKSLFFSGMWVCFLTSLILGALLILINFFLDDMGQEQSVVDISYSYYWILIASLPFYMVFLGLKQFMEGLESTSPGMLILVVSNIINLILNYIFIFGKFGFEPMGLEGAGWATLISRIILMLLAIYVISSFRKFKTYLDFSYSKVNWTEIKEIFGIGFPIGLQIAFEVGIFSVGTIFAGMIGKYEQAAHKIALDLAAFTFMIASGFGSSSTISISNYFGKGNYIDMKKSAYAALVLTLIFMSFTCILFLTLNEYFPLAFNDDKNVLQIASGLLIIAGFFQISDGLQVTTLGILRGLHDVKIPTIVTLISYWMIGIPLAYYLSITLEIGPAGIWYGYLTGLSLVAITMFIRFELISKKLLKIN